MLLIVGITQNLALCSVADFPCLRMMGEGRHGVYGRRPTLRDFRFVTGKTYTTERTKHSSSSVRPPDADFCYGPYLVLTQLLKGCPKLYCLSADSHKRQVSPAQIRHITVDQSLLLFSASELLSCPSLALSQG